MVPSCERKKAARNEVEERDHFFGARKEAKGKRASRVPHLRVNYPESTHASVNCAVGGFPEFPWASVVLFLVFWRFLAF